MKTRDQLISFGKMRNSVQQMIAQAREIAYPSNIKARASCSHLQIYLPPTKINRHLQQLLSMPLDSNKKIERPKRIGSVLLQNSRKQERLESSLNILARNLSPNELKSPFRYELKDTQQKYQHYVLHNRYRKYLDSRKNINCTELPEISIKANSKSIQSKSQQKIKLAKQSISTIDQKYTNNLSHQYLNQAKPLNTISHNQAINRNIVLKNIYKRKLKSSLMQKIEDKKFIKLELKKKKKMVLSRQLIEDFGSDPQPWQAEYKDFQIDYNL